MTYLFKRFTFREISEHYTYKILICYRRDFNRGRVGYSQLTVPNPSDVPFPDLPPGSGVYGYGGGGIVPRKGTRKIYEIARRVQQ